MYILNKTNAFKGKGFINMKHSNNLPFLTLFTTSNFDKDISQYLKENISDDIDVYFPIQKHTDSVLIIDQHIPKIPVVADAVLTNRHNLIIGVKTADCVPIIIYDRISQSIGAIHAGWRGTAKSIVIKTIDKMISNFGAKVDNISVMIGASIGRCCYEVDEDVFSKIISVTPDNNFWTKKGEKYHIDLQLSNTLQALTTGILRENISIIQECTCCLNDKYHSYRRDGKIAGRQYAVIGMV